MVPESQINLRPATSDDAGLIFAFVGQLAAFGRMEGTARTKFAGEPA